MLSIAVIGAQSSVKLLRMSLDSKLQSVDVSAFIMRISNNRII